MSKIKKVLAVLLTLAMVLGMSVSAFAAATGTGEIPTAEDVAKASVYNILDVVDGEAEVWAYQIIEGTYDNGFTGYKVVDAVAAYLAGVDMEAGDNQELFPNPKMGPTSTQVTTIAAEINKENSTLAKELKHVQMFKDVSEDAQSGQYSANLNAGYWIVIVKGTDTTIYNPMLVGVYYSVGGELNNTLTGGVVDADSKWKLVSEDAYAKSTAPDVEKVIVNPASKNNKGDDVAIGDVVTYNINTTIPGYSDEYEEVIFNISDVLSNGLTNNKDATVSVNGSVIKTAVVQNEEDVNTFSDDVVANIYYADNQHMLIVFKNEYVLVNDNVPVKVEYTATLNDNAGRNFDPNTNTVTLEYTNNPADKTDTVKKDDRTYTYTFALDSSLYGTSETLKEYVTKELVKVDADTWIEETTSTGEKGYYEKKLAGAKFRLTRTDADVPEGKEAWYQEKETDADGLMKFDGLDAGKYVLEEIKAPDGYTLNTKKIEVEIKAYYNNKFGYLEKYEVYVDGKKAQSTYIGTYENGATEIEHEVVGITNVTKETDIPNTKLVNLPSTGGIGTTIFTVGGCLIMIIAAGLFFASRRKSSK